MIVQSPDTCRQCCKIGKSFLYRIGLTLINTVDSCRDHTFVFHTYFCIRPITKRAISWVFNRKLLPDINLTSVRRTRVVLLIAATTMNHGVCAEFLCNNEEFKVTQRECKLLHKRTTSVNGRL